MIRGLGIDIIEIERIRNSMDRHGQHFLNKMFTLQEQNYCLRFKDPVPHFAGRFAAKEAIVKALGTGFGASVSWLDIEVLNSEHGTPMVFLSDELQKRFSHPILLVSISHAENYATSVATWSVRE